jgi:RNA polymerase sigma-70 factor (ECF subfamily)
VNTFQESLVNRGHPEPALEAQQLTRAQQGDREAQSWLIDAHQDAVYGLALRLVGGHRERAEDLAQEAFLRALRALPRFRGESAFRTWMHRIVVNLHINQQATLAARNERSALSLAMGQEDDGARGGAVELASNAPRPDQEADVREQSAILVDALDELEEGRRTVVVLRDLRGFAYEEIAEQLGIPIGTVRSRLSRAREDLRRRWKEIQSLARHVASPPVAGEESVG